MEIRKYFDYELGILGYQHFKKVFELVEDIKKLGMLFDTTCDLENLQDYDYLTFHLSDFNCDVFLVQKNGKFELSSKITIYSYESCTDNLDIKHINDLMLKRVAEKQWGQQHNYTDNDFRREYESINKAINLIIKNNYNQGDYTKDIQETLQIINDKFQTIKDNINTNNALDYIREIVEILQNTYDL